MMKALVSFFILIVSITLTAQDGSPLIYKDQVKLKTGSVFTGEIIRVSVDTIALELRSGFVYLIPGELVYKAIQYSEINYNFSTRIEQFLDYDKKWFLGLDIGLGFGNSVERKIDAGNTFDFSLIVQNRVAPKHFLNARANFRHLAVHYPSITVFDLQFGHEFLFRNPGRVTPFVGYRGGPSIVFNDDDLKVKQNGLTLGAGVYVGYYKSLGTKSAFRSEIGYYAQNYKYHYVNEWAWTPTSVIRNFLSRSVVLRMGYVF